MILQSKMNYKFNISKYSIALHFLDRLPHEKWVSLCDVPNSIKTEVIELLDTGFNNIIKSIFNDDCTEFLLTSIKPIEAVAITCKLKYKPRGTYKKTRVNMRIYAKL